MHLHKIVEFGKKGLTGFLLIVMIVSMMGLATPKKTVAAEPVVEVGGNLIQSTISAVADVAAALGLESLVLKEFSLDGILFFIGRQVLLQMQRSLIRWINSGFKGSPAFVADLEAFLINVADQAAGEIIYGTELGFLCSPFELDIRLGLQLNYRASAARRIQCTLSSAIGNAENSVNRFLGGNFLAGGMEGWLELTTNPNNNFFGVQASTQRLLIERVNNRITLDLSKLNWGNGFLSKAACTAVGEQENCTITMPGKAISEMLTFELSTGKRALLNADEINEIISALFAQLAQQALQGAAGLLGLTSTGGSYGNTSYIDRMGNTNFDEYIGGAPITEEDDGLFGTAINDENAYRALYANVVSRAQAIIVQAQSNSSCSNATNIINQTNPILNEALQKQNDADANLSLLRSLQSEYNTASDEEKINIVQELSELRASGRLHTSFTNAQEKFRTDELVIQLGQIASQLNNLCGTPGGGQSGGE